MRNDANLNQLLVLANMESYNAILIEQGKPQSERLILFRNLAISQINGYSLDAQKTKMKAFCDYNEYEIVGEYEDKHYQRRKTDLENHLYKTYDKIDEAEELLVSAKAKKRSLLADKITGDNIYKALIFFDKLYAQMNESEKREFLSQLVDNDTQNETVCLLSQLKQKPNDYINDTIYLRGGIGSC